VADSDQIFVHPDLWGAKSVRARVEHTCGRLLTL
jgi:hypothetical protein